MRVGIYTGSFDPLTLGHSEVIFAAGRLFDRLVAAIGVNPSKTPVFTQEERAAFITAECANQLASTGCELVVESFAGLTVEAARAFGAGAIVRGLREGADFDFEMQLAGTNAALAPELQTLFIPAPPMLRHVSGTLVRQIASMGGDVSSMVPHSVAAALAAKFKTRF